MEETKIVKSTEICSLSTVRRVAAMLDLDPVLFSIGDVLPPSWHFFMLAGQTRKSALRADGFPGLGVEIPDLGLPRLLLGGRKVTYNADILIGSEIERTSFVKSISEKNGQSGPMAIVTIQHELREISAEKPAIVETQTYVLLEEKPIRNDKLGIRNLETGNKNVAPDLLLIPNSKFLIKTPDETLLFQYSALGFNSHKIHLDRDYAKNVEGLPDLVVNGGLATLLLTEYMRTKLNLKIKDLSIKHIAPLYCNRRLSIDFENEELRIYNDKNEVAVEVVFNA
jgi:3-methylfumaryl-CoA hydratase